MSTTKTFLAVLEGICFLYNNAMDMLTSDQQLEIKSENARAVVSLRGAQVLQWDVRADGEYVQTLYQGSSVKRTGIPLLFPHFGKSAKYRMHGFGRDSVWKIRRHEESTVELSLSGELLDDKARVEYDYKFEAHAKVSVSENKLDYELTVRNRDVTPLPIMPGLHPYWKINHEEKTGLVINGLKEFDARKVNWTEAPPDNVYDYAGEVKVDLGDFWVRIADQSKDQNIKRLVVWSQTPARDPDYDFVCVEPACGAHYEIDTNPISVSPDQEWQMKVSFEFAVH
jgi:D-hexose-6-phosphate mutarotase